MGIQYWKSLDCEISREVNDHQKTVRIPSLNALIIDPRYSELLPSSRAGVWVAKELGGEVAKDIAGIERNLPTILRERLPLVIVNSPMLYVDKHYRNAIFSAIEKALEVAVPVVYLQNDYTIDPPTPIRRNRAFVPYWTNHPKDMAKCRESQYMNWNSLSYVGGAPPFAPDSYGDYLVYWGACRNGRRESFDRYFTSPHQRVQRLIFCSASAQKKFTTFADTSIIYADPAPLPNITAAGVSLYLEDSTTHNDYHSPGTRFYEALSAGMPQLFDAKCANTFKTAGFDISAWTVESYADVDDMFAAAPAHKLARQQWELWTQGGTLDLLSPLRNLLHEEFKKLKEA